MATYSAQCSAVGSFNYANYFKLYVELTETDVSIANNTSKVKYNVYCKSSGSGSISANHYLYFNINGSDKRNETVKVNVSSPNAYIAIASGTTDAIQHNNDGSKTISFSAQIKASSYGVSASTSGTFTLSTIARASSVSGGSGNIGSNLTISVSRASSSFIHTLRYAFGSLSGTIATGVGASHSWTIPTSFYEQVPDAKSKTGTIYCDTYNGGSLIGTKSTTFTATVTEASSRPTVTATLTDTNATTKALTGNASKMVKGKSTGQLVITSTVKNSATIKSVTVNGTNVGTAGSITKTYANISTASYKIVTTDSRGFTNTSYVLTPSYVNYVPLTLNTKIFRPQSTGTEIQMTYSGNYFNASFGSVANTLSIKWNYKVKGATSWTTGGTITPTLNGNTISSKTISLGTNYNYQTAYEFQIIATDKLITINQTIPVTVGMPVFYWGKNFFKFTHNPSISKDSGDTGYFAKRTDTGVGVWTGVGSGGANHGVYSQVLQKWIACADKNYIKIGTAPTGKVGIPVGEGFLVIKSANNTEAPNNGVVLEYGNSTSWTGQLFIGDNSYQGVYYNGWSDGVRGQWKKLGWDPVSLYDNASGSNGTITLSQSAADFKYLQIFFKSTYEHHLSTMVAAPNGKTASLSYFHVFPQSNTCVAQTRTVAISGTTIATPSSNEAYGQWWSNGNSINLENKIYILKVLGYR